ncbi:MAG: hypothetical protein VYA84_17320 [Planctomycetota bacterium]|nr:hypothetical protein [Planctomycetota bacterium]
MKTSIVGCRGKLLSQVSNPHCASQSVSPRRHPKEGRSDKKKDRGYGDQSEDQATQGSIDFPRVVIGKGRGMIP